MEDLLARGAEEELRLTHEHALSAEAESLLEAQYQDAFTPVDSAALQQLNDQKAIVIDIATAQAVAEAVKASEHTQHKWKVRRSWRSVIRRQNARLPLA